MAEFFKYKWESLLKLNESIFKLVKWNRIQNIFEMAEHKMLDIKEVLNIIFNYEGEITYIFRWKFIKTFVVH